MKVSVTVVLDVETEKWANNNNGPWPEYDKRSLNTAVRQDIKKHIEWVMNQQAFFEELGIEVEVK